MPPSLVCNGIRSKGALHIPPSPSECLKCSKVPKMPKVNAGFPRCKIGHAKGEHLNFRSLKAHSIRQESTEYI